MARKSQIDIVLKARDQASAKLGKVGRASRGLAGNLSSLKTLAAGLGVGIGVAGIMQFARSSYEAFGRQEKATRRLSDALGLLGKMQRGTRAEMTGFAADIQKITTIGDEAVLEMMSLGSSLGKLSGESLKDATKAAIGLSKALGTDTTAAMRLVARAAIGDTSQLARYGIKLAEGMSAQEKFNELLRIGAGSFKLATGEAKTLTGQMDQLANSWGDAKEKAGGYFAEVAAGMIVLARGGAEAAARHTTEERAYRMRKQEQGARKQLTALEIERFKPGERMTEDQRIANLPRPASPACSWRR